MTVVGNPVLVQSRFGQKGNFELVCPAAGGGLAFLWRDNDAAGMPWSAPFVFGQGLGRVDAVTMIQSNFGSPGNMELIARVGDRLHLFWRDSGPAFRWTGPFGMLVGFLRLRATQRPDGRFIEVDGEGFTPNADVTISYGISAGGGPTTHQNGEDRVRANGAGRFHREIKVNLAGDIAAVRVGARDEATQMSVDAQL